MQSFKLKSFPGNNTLQWLLVAGVGILAGLATLKMLALEPRWFMLVFAACGFAIILLIVNDVRRLLLTLILFDIPFQLDIHLGFRDDIPSYGAIGGWSLSITSIALAALYLMWFMETWGNRRQQGQERHLFKNIWPLGLYLLFCLLSIPAAQDMQLAAFENFMLLQQFLLFIYLVATVKSREEVKYILLILFIGLVMEGTIVILMRGVGHTLEIAGMKARVDKGMRIGGTVGGPNTAGGYFGLLLIPALSMLVAKADKLHKWSGALGFCLGAMGIILTMSRGGWLAFLLSGTIFITISWLRGWISIRLPVAIFIVAVLLALLYQDVLLERLFGDDDGAAQARVPLMKLAFRIILANPISGVGINNFSLVMKDYINYDINGLWLYAVHNKFLLVWAEIGPAGLLAFLWYLMFSIRNGWRCWKSQDAFFAPVGLAIAAAIIGHMAHMNFDTFQNRALVQVLWISCALTAIMLNILQQDKQAGGKHRPMRVAPKT